MKSERTIRRQIRELRAMIDSPATDPIMRRMAYTIETALTWATSRTVGWPSQVEDAKAAAHLIRQEFKP